ncbi:MAG TPA: pitrilysin family protein, partial [Bacteroidia bacterium]|nr:pitrilysin family protein [Bacteroidia bacterium]
MKKRSLFRLTLVPVALLLLASAAQDKGPFPDIERYKLKNGLEVIFADYGDLPVTSLTFFVNVGKKSETPGQQGLAGLTANSLLLGNDKFSRTDQDRMLYRLGTGISADANENFTTVSGEFLNTDIGKGFEIVSAVLLHPTFPQQDIDEEKNLDISQNKPSKMDIGDLASMYGNYFCYGIGHPLGRHFYEAQYKKITTAQIRDFYNFNYTPGNTKLVVCGKPDREKVKALIEQYFGGWNATYGEVNGSSYDIPPIKTREFAFVPKDSAKQACLLWMKKGPAAGSKDMTAFIIANAVFSDHLTKEIREKRGYTYGIYSTFSQAQDDGIFRARTQVRNDVMFATMTAFDNVLTEFYAK